MFHFIFVHNNLIVKKDNQNVSLPSAEDIKSLNLQGDIVQDDTEAYVLNLAKTDFNFDEFNLHSINIRQALVSFDHKISEKIVYYLQLAHYYSLHKFCGICGRQLFRQEHSKFMFCNHCQHDFYPKLSPCIIVRITRGEEILLARGTDFPTNIWALIAGFVDLGENLEEALRREVREEVGIEVDNIQYWGSQSWPIPTSSLMIGFTAEYKSGEIEIDNDEIAQAGFFTRDTIPGKPPTHFSISSAMIDEFIG